MIKISLLLALLFSVNQSRADNMTVFLKSCAYGTVAGAGLGLASLAISENPNSKINNVARGASLGLYAGIGFGLYTIYGKKKESGSLDISQNLWLSPMLTHEKFQGAQLNWAVLGF